MRTAVITLLKAIAAGIMISVGCAVYMMSSSPVVGAFLFSFGLFTIVTLGLNLYTGKIGYLADQPNLKYALELLLTIAGNALGAFLTAAAVSATRLSAVIAERILSVTEVKNADSFLSLFILAFFCGILMYLGVNIHKTAENPLSRVLAVVFAVMIFILSGFEHCVANMFYYFFAGNTDILRLLCMIAGNSAGSLFIALLTKDYRKKE